MLLKLVPPPHRANIKVQFATGTKEKKEKNRQRHVTSQCLANMEIVPIYIHY